MNVSVIIPAYNAENSIRRAILSVLAQGMNNLIEIIVVNDGSTDSTKKVVEKIINENPSCNIYLYTQENSGVASARNLGVGKSRFELIAFLDSDDEWVKNKLNSQVNFFYQNPEYDLIAGNFKGLNARFDKLKKIDNSHYYEVFFSDVLLKHYFQPSTVLLKKVVFNEVGGFKEGMTHAEEGLLFYKINYSHRCVIDEEITIIYGQDKHSFNDSGLASNLKKMHEGEIYNLKYIFRENKINKFTFFKLFCFFKLKYIRRCIIKIINKVMIASVK